MRLVRLLPNVTSPPDAATLDHDPPRVHRKPGERCILRAVHYGCNSEKGSKNIEPYPLACGTERHDNDPLANDVVGLSLWIAAHLSGTYLPEA